MSSVRKGGPRGSLKGERNFWKSCTPASCNVVLGIPNCLAAFLIDQLFFFMASIAAARLLACAASSNILVFFALGDPQFNRKGEEDKGKGGLEQK